MESHAMAKPKKRIKNATNSATIAATLLAELRRHAQSKIIDLKAVIAARAKAEEQQKTVATPQRLAQLHPAHAAYVYAQNQISVMTEELSRFSATKPLSKIVVRAEDYYSPGGPPLSPLTTSYFSCWAAFDACVGSTYETFGAVALAVAAALEIDDTLLGLMRLMQESHMGIYVHEGADGDLVVLRDLVTERERRCLVPSKYRGTKGELWYARVLPPPHPCFSEHVVFTTPYVLLDPRLSAWAEYFSRTLPATPPQDRIDAYEHHMKFGPSRHYWNDFVFEGYSNYRTEAVYLVGLPDIPASRPHYDARFANMAR
jgi:hypothetical protein